MRSIAFADFLIGLGILFVLEGLMFAAIPAWLLSGHEPPAIAHQPME